MKVLFAYKDSGFPFFPKDADFDDTIGKGWCFLSSDQQCPDKERRGKMTEYESIGIDIPKKTMSQSLGREFHKIFNR